MHLYQEKFGVLAVQMCSNDPDFEIMLKTAISAKDLKRTLTYSSKMAQKVQQERNLSKQDVLQLAYELFLVVFEKINMSDDRKEKMAATINKKLMSAASTQGDTSASAPPSKPKGAAQPQKPKVAAPPQKPSSPEPTTTSAKRRPKIFSSETKAPAPAADTSATPESEQVEVKPKRPKVFSSSTLTKDEPAAEDTLASKAEEAPQKELTEEEKQRLERAELRKKKKEEAKAKKLEKTTGKEAIDFDPFPILDEWLRSDKTFMREVDHFEKLGPNSMRILLDPEGEGFINFVDIQIKTLKYGKHNIIRVKCISDSGKKFPYNIAIGNSGKRWVAASLYDNISENENETIEQLKEVDFKNQMEWDRLMVILNNDKSLMKAIKSLQLKNPAPGVKEMIHVPVYIKKDIPSNKIIVHTFLSPKIKPSTVFLNIMDVIAESMSQLGDTDGGGATESLGSRFDQIAANNKVDVSNYQFRYLEKDEAVSFKSCPYCGKPFPSAIADYRRCPNCLKKLK